MSNRRFARMSYTVSHVPKHTKVRELGDYPGEVEQMLERRKKRVSLDLTIDDAQVEI
jgi:hypothetical protein